MPLGVKASWLQTAAFQGAAPDPCEQVVIDIAVGAGGEKHQPVGVIETQLLHLLLVLLERCGEQWGERHYPLLACLGAAPNMISGGIPIPLEGLVNQYLLLIPVDTIPSQTPDFCISHPRAHPQQEERVKPFFVGLEVTQHRLDFSGREHITLDRPLGDFEGVTKQVAVASRALTAVHQDGADGAIG